jgi:hypothetical protein
MIYTKSKGTNILYKSTYMKYPRAVKSIYRRGIVCWDCIQLQFCMMKASWILVAWLHNKVITPHRFLLCPYKWSRRELLMYILT